MSLEQVLKVWKSDAKGATQQILLVLANAADPHGNNVYPSQAYTAWRTKLELGTVKRVFRELRGKGVLVLVRRGGQRPGERRSNEYKLDLDRLPLSESFAAWCLANDIGYSPFSADAAAEIAESERGDLKTPRSGERGDPDAGRGDRGSRERGDRRSPKIKESETKGSKGGGARERAPASPPARREPTPIPVPFILTEAMKEWARVNAPSLRPEVIAKETAIFELKMRGAGKLSFDWFAEWCVFMLRKTEWVAKDAAASPQQQLPLEGDAAGATPAPKLKPADPDCKRCYGTGHEVVPGRGARTCACRLLDGAAREQQQPTSEGDRTDERTTEGDA